MVGDSSDTVPTVVDVRPVGTGELEAAFAVWLGANAAEGRSLSVHFGQLRNWAEEEGAELLVAEEAGLLVGMVLCLEGRAADGLGETLPDLWHVTGLAVLPG